MNSALRVLRVASNQDGGVLRAADEVLISQRRESTALSVCSRLFRKDSPSVSTEAMNLLNASMVSALCRVGGIGKNQENSAEDDGFLYRRTPVTGFEESNTR